MKDSQHAAGLVILVVKYIKVNNERFSTIAGAPGYPA